MLPLLIIPAAGASSRMKGRDKLMEPVSGQPLLRRQTAAAVRTGLPVAVLLPPGPSPRRAALDGLVLHIEDVPDAAEGLAASLRRGAALAAPDQPLAILLPDLPGLRRTEIDLTYAAFRAAGGTRVTRGADPEGRAGAPVFLPARLVSAFLTLKGDTGGREVLKGEDTGLVRFEDDRALRDLDTPEDWTAWRAETGQHG